MRRSGRLILALLAVFVLIGGPLAALLVYDQLSPDRPVTSRIGALTGAQGTTTSPRAAPATRNPGDPQTALPVIAAGATAIGTSVAGAAPQAAPPPQAQPQGTPPPGRQAPDERLRTFWRTYGDFPGRGTAQNSLGWATGPAAPVQMAYQPFEGWRGEACQSESSEMFWRADTRAITFLVQDAWGENPAGCPQSWQGWPDTWNEGDPSNPDIVSPSESRRTPIRGFGKVWREQLYQRTPGLPDGFATAREVGFTGLVQRFENGTIIAWPERNRVWILFDRFTYTTPNGQQQTRPVWVSGN